MGDRIVTPSTEDERLSWELIMVLIGPEVIGQLGVDEIPGFPCAGRILFVCELPFQSSSVERMIFLFFFFFGPVRRDLTLNVHRDSSFFASSK